MTVKGHYFCFLSVFFLAVHVLEASPETRAQARKRGLLKNAKSGEKRACQNPLLSSHSQVNKLEQSLLEAVAQVRKREIADVRDSKDHDDDQESMAARKRSSPETPKIQALSLEQASYSVKPDFEAMLKKERSLKGLVLAEDDVAGLSDVHARWLVHMSIKQNYSDKESLSLLTEKCSLGAVRDLIIEASMADRPDVVHLLVAQAQKLDREKGLSVNEHKDLSTASYHAMAIGYYAAQCQQRLNEKEIEAAIHEGKKSKPVTKSDKPTVIDWFKQVYSTDFLFREAVNEVKHLSPTQSF